MSRRCSSGGEMAIVVELVARYERSLLEGGTVASLDEIERLLRIKRQLATIAMVERANALARGPERAEDEDER